MKLADLRKVAVKKNLIVRFPLSNGMECVLNQHGIAQVPALRSVPDFNLEDEFTRVQEFLVEPAQNDKGKSKPHRYTRGQMAELAAAGTGGETAHDEHED